MTELLHATALVPATVGACCTIGARRTSRTLAMVSAVLMAVAMADMAFGFVVMPALAWTAMLLTAALGTATALRFVPRERRDPHGPVMALHGAIGLMLMAALLLPSGPPAVVASAAGPGEHILHGGVPTGIGVVAVIAYSAYTVWVVVRITTRRHAGSGMNPVARTLTVVEALCMGLSTLFMASAAAL